MDLPPEVPALAAHASELRYLFDLPIDTPPLTAKQRHLGDRMIGYWARFAATGNPNGPGLPAWPRVDPGGTVPYVQGLDLDRIGPFDRAGAHNLAFWDGLGAR